MEDITPQKIVETLIEKHDNYIRQYSDSVDGVKRLGILKEKKDQLEHWVADEGGGMYKTELEKTSKELEELESKIVDPELNSAQMKARLDDHKSAKTYWTKKLEALTNNG